MGPGSYARGVGKQRRAMRTSRVARTVGPARVAGRAALRWASTYLAWGERRQRRREHAVLRTAEDVTRALGEMKGGVMKVGQVLSLMTGMVPPEMAGRLSSLQQDAPPMAYELVRQVFLEEFGEGPERRFRRFERQPFAAASIGQVHRAELHDGTRVAVKVQYPGVREAMTHDLANMGFLVTMLGSLQKGMDATTVVRNMKEGILGELDYRQEAANQARFAEQFAGHAFVRVPRVFPGLSGERVLVQEYLEGQRFAAALDLPQEERDRVAEIVFRYAFGNFYRFGLFNGDPHPGNYLLLPGGRVGFLDYGCVSTFAPGTIDGFKRILFALYAGDLEGWRGAVEEIGMLRRDAPFTTEQLYAHMHWFWKPVLEEEVTFTPELAGEMVRRNSMTTGEGGAINRWLNIPDGMFFLTRINFGLAGLLGALHARGRWRAIIEEYMTGSPPATELGRLSAATSRGPAV